MMVNIGFAILSGLLFLAAWVLHKATERRLAEINARLEAESSLIGKLRAENDSRQKHHLLTLLGRAYDKIRDTEPQCEHCFQPLTCNAKLVEENSGLHHSLDQALDRAEHAESKLAAAQQETP